MEIAPMTCYDNLKRYWRRRKYKRLNGSNHNNKRKLKIVRLGDHGTSGRWQSKTRDSNKTKLTCLETLFSLGKLFSMFHETYMHMMIHLAGNVAHRSTGAGAFAGKKVARTEQISMVSCGEELVDSKLVLEIYKRVAASRQMNSIAY